MKIECVYAIGALLLAGAGLFVGCSGGDSGAQLAGPSSVAGSISGLRAGISVCAEKLSSCGAEGEAGASSCHDDFATCRQAADEAAAPGMEQAVQTCADAARACRDAAQAAADMDTCHDQLQACTDADEATPGAQPAAGPAHAAPSPLADCRAALRACLEGDEAAKVCTGQLRTCVMSAVGADVHEAGASEHADHDAAEPEPAAHE